MLNIGHRGARGYAPENTLASFKKAIELGVDAIELDVQLCKSDELIVMHDDTVDRTTDGSGLVKKMKLKELKELDAGTGERIPTLEEVLDLVNPVRNLNGESNLALAKTFSHSSLRQDAGHSVSNGVNRRVKVNIELKGPKTAKPVMKLIDEYAKNKGWSLDDFIISSFKRKELREARSLNPMIQIGVLISKPRLIDRWSFRFAQKIRASFIGPGKKLVSRRFVRKAHDHGLKVFVWTGNKLIDVKPYDKIITKLKRFDIDGIFSDYPDRLTKTI